MNTDSQHLQQVSEEFQHMVEEFFLVQSRYSAAIKEIQTKLEILDDEFQMRHRRNPIHHMQSRLKTIQSMLEKLKRKNYEVSINSAVKNLQDIAGIRVICSYVQDEPAGQPRRRAFGSHGGLHPRAEAERLPQPAFDC